MQVQTQDNILKTIAAVAEAGCVVRGSHRPEGYPGMQLAGIAILTKTDKKTGDIYCKEVVALCHSDYYSLNPIQLDKDGKPYIGNWSVGGVLVPKNFADDLRATVADYNAADRMFDIEKLDIVATARGGVADHIRPSLQSMAGI